MRRLLISTLLTAAASAVPAQAAKKGVAFFEKHVRPILADHCYGCHSEEADRVKGELLLDTRAGWKKGGANGPVIVPGHPEKSRLIQAVRREGDLKMPPADEGEPLTQREVQRLVQWVKLGAPDPRDGEAADVPESGIQFEQAQQEWPYRPLRRPEPPAVHNDAWVRNPIDRFVLARLEDRGLSPGPPASDRKLVRRAYYDLVGLPPKPTRVRRFVNNRSPGAWPRLIDRLLASPRFGERWARHWLDVARFAESMGFEHDYNRPHAYHYRDFVIRAFNRDMPYDRFVRWQLAGDEIAPEEPLAMMGTGFLAAGPFPTQLTEAEFEQARYNEMDDMLTTTANAMLGLTVGCARCHDHKYDPIPMRDYYRMLSTFTTSIRSNVKVEMHPDRTERALAKWKKAHEPLVDGLESFEQTELPRRFETWAKKKNGTAELPPWVVLAVTKAESKGGATFDRLDDGSLLLTGENPKKDRWTLTARTHLRKIRAVRLEALAHESLEKGGPGRAPNGNFALTNLRVTAKPLGSDAEPKEVALAGARATFEQNSKNLSVAAAIDDDKQTGWAVDPKFGEDHAAVFKLEKPVGFEQGTLLTFHFRFENNTRHSIGRPRLSVTTREGEVPLDADGAFQPRVEPRRVLARAGGYEALSGRRREDLMKLYRWVDPKWRKLHRRVEAHRRKKPTPEVKKVLVTSEGVDPIPHHADSRGYPHFYDKTYFLKRGDPSKKQEPVEQGFLRVLMRGKETSHWKVAPPDGTEKSYRRRSMANWITDVEHGAGNLLARVIVNRLWQHHIGRAIVRTPNDFGSQGKPPTHPKLLDWLATELIRRGWRLKPIHKLIMDSATYRQAVRDDAAGRSADPQNKLLWTRPRRRLEAEVIRDAMLSVAGRLSKRMYGPGTLDPSMRRRSIYFTIKRSELIPMLQLFDAPRALVSLGKRETTTVAPQALMLMNSPHVRRYAEAFARRLERRGARSWEETVDRAYRIALSRPPREQEQSRSVAFLEAQRRTYADRPEKEARHKARTDFCQALMELNEFIYVE